jgi:hypothetical protein
VRLLAVVISLLLCSASSFARVGIVRTLTGETVQGHVRITRERVIVVNAARGLIFNVYATNIAEISFPTNALSIRKETIGDESLPAAWREVDIGLTRIGGSARHEHGTFTVRGSGLNIDGDRDSFHYVYKPVRGDSEIVAEVESIQYTHPNAKAGLMMRENLGEYSRNVMLALTAMNGGAFQFRANEGLNTESLALRGLFAPQWLKLRRRGDEFSAFVSRNGRAWSLLQQVSLAMNENIYVGLTVASAQDGFLNWSTFRKVREAPKLINEDFTPQVELVSGSTIFGRPERADENEVMFGGEPKVVRVPTVRVARIAFQPLSDDIAWKTRMSRAGVWVNNGDFFDGDFRGIEHSRLRVSSVLYGPRTFDIDDEVLALVLQPRRFQRTQFEVLTTDGSILLATELALGDGEVKVKESALGEVRLPAFEIVELRRR